MTTENQPPVQRPKTIGSLLGGVGLGLLVATMGTIFVFAMIHGYDRAVETREWTEVPMTITKSEVFDQRIDSGPREYKAIVEYAFAFGGKQLSGAGIKRTEGFTKHKSKADRIINRYPVGSTGTAWVNPQDPQQTVLKHNTKAVIYTVWFPGLFVIAGLGIAVGSIRSHLRD
ncbi:MAG: hypothetical protein ACI8XO_002800 [Verrucomicrobiales bacterium]|jgi:hypothetical protein